MLEFGGVFLLDWRNLRTAGRLRGRQRANLNLNCDMETNTINGELVRQKTRELCQAIVEQPEFDAIRKSVESFMADPQAQVQYQTLSEKGRQLHQKQEQGIALDSAEIAAFDSERAAFFRNPVAKDFVEAQQHMHEMQDEVAQIVSKTFELGRVPSHEDLEGGSCGHGCGCHH
jgi:cell fate (sporulation/competence/biofilm development) regulator YlbF (YheA/YmcA/DUF963 family)